MTETITLFKLNVKKIEPKQPKFTLKDFNAFFPDDDACLAHLFAQLYGNLPDFHKYYKVNERKVYAHSETGKQICPTAGTIFHKSRTPLKDWYYVVYKFSTNLNGLSAKEIQRELGVTYKCAWRMCNQIRKLFDDTGSPQLSGTVEIDETYIGGKQEKANGKFSNKTAVIGAVQRNGNIVARVVDDTQSKNVKPFVRGKIKRGSNILTDENPAYKEMKYDYNHASVNHSKKEYVNREISINTIENFWSQFKRSVDGTFHLVSPKYLQMYVNEFTWRYNNRDSYEHRFNKLIKRI